MARTIKIYTSCNEYTDTHYYRMFKVVDKLPAVGDTYEGGTVTELNEVRKDIENSGEAEDMDCYLVKYKDEEDEGWEDYIAISHSKPNHMVTVLVYDFILPPTVETASQILEEAIKSDNSPLSGNLESYINCCCVDEDETLIQSYFRITPEIYEEVVTAALTANYGKKDLCDLDGNKIKIEADATGVRISMDVPYWWTYKDCLYIRCDLVDSMTEAGKFAKRTIDDLSPVTIDTIIDRIIETMNIEGMSGGDWIHVAGYPVWFNLISLNVEDILSISDLLVDVCCKPFKEFIKDLGYTQATFSRRYRIPRRTVQDWCLENIPCRIYLRLMFAELEGLLPRRKKEW